MKALLYGGIRQNHPSGFSSVGMPAKQVSLSVLKINSRSQKGSYNLRISADTPRKATAKSRLLSSSERPNLEDTQERRLKLASYQVSFTN